MRKARQSTGRSARRSTRVRTRWNTGIRTRWKIKELITIWVSSILKASLLNSLMLEAKLIQVTNMAIKHANKSFLSQLGSFFPHFSLWVEGWLWIGWVIVFGWFEWFLFFIVVGARSKFRGTLLIPFLTSLKPNPQSICGFGCTLLNPTQILLNYLLTQFSFFKMSNQIGGLLLKLSVLFGSMKMLTLERETRFTWRG
jgi:hypothetical protein